MPFWLLPLILGAAGAGVGQATTHHTKGTLEGAFGGLGLALGLDALMPAAAPAAAAGADAGTLAATSAAGSSGAGLAGSSLADAATLGSAASSGIGAADAGALSGIGSGITGANFAVPAATQAATATANPGAWAKLGAWGAHKALPAIGSQAAAIETQRAMTPKVTSTEYGQWGLPPPQQPQQQGQQMQLPDYRQQLQMLGFA